VQDLSVDVEKCRKFPTNNIGAPSGLPSPDKFSPHHNNRFGRGNSHQHHLSNYDAPNFGDEKLLPRSSSNELSRRTGPSKRDQSRSYYSTSENDSMGSRASSVRRRKQTGSTESMRKKLNTKNSTTGSGQPRVSAHSLSSSKKVKKETKKKKKISNGICGFFSKKRKNKKNGEGCNFSSSDEFDENDEEQ